MHPDDTRTGPKIYVRLRKTVRLTSGQPLTIQKLARLGTDPATEQRLNRLELDPVDIGDPKERVIDVLQIIRLIHRVMPEAEIEHVGEPQVVVERAHTERKPFLLWVFAVWMLLFTGSGLAIMNFHADVSMKEVHQKMYTVLTGERIENPLLLQIPYSFGLGAGMILFFNRFFRKKLNDEPDPLELEVFNYQENIRSYRIDQEMKNQKDG